MALGGGRGKEGKERRKGGKEGIRLLFGGVNWDGMGWDGSLF